jgi:hypothetical protein
VNPPLLPIIPWRVRWRAPAGALVLLSVAPLAGCQLFGFIAVASRDAEERRVRDVGAEYKGLQGRTFAVVVATDRVVRADHPGVVEEITTRVSEQLYKGAGATGWIPPDRVLAWQYSHPRWVVMPRDELAKELGVDRLIVVELNEFRLNEPGNQYLWAGVAEGVVGVIEAGGSGTGAGLASPTDEFAFQKPVTVRYPDKSGYGPSDISGAEVASVLLKRFVDRSSWPFYTHKETGKMDY